MSVPKSRILDLMKVQCRIFSSTFNPERLRTGNKVLRERLKGPSVAAYYPRRDVTFKDLKNLYPDLETWDDDEEDRLEHLALMKQRGKGAPKKKSSADRKITVRLMQRGSVADLVEYRIEENHGQKKEACCSESRLRHYDRDIQQLNLFQNQGLKEQ
ncbi:MAG: hypothetical protein Q9188_001529 [Gyalolechia gomerana]